jgi:hypothetical protein
MHLAHSPANHAAAAADMQLGSHPPHSFLAGQEQHAQAASTPRRLGGPPQALQGQSRTSMASPAVWCRAAAGTAAAPTGDCMRHAQVTHPYPTGARQQPTVTQNHSHADQGRTPRFRVGTTAFRNTANQARRVQKGNVPPTQRPDRCGPQTRAPSCTAVQSRDGQPSHMEGSRQPAS